MTRIIQTAILFSTLVIGSCNTGEKKTTEVQSDTGTIRTDTLQVPPQKETDPVPPPPTYSNNRFRDVKLERLGKDSFLVSGKAQVFEATFNWVVEDGHEELKKGYQTTSAGAPEWGHFEFGLRVQKRRENSTLTLIIFESSPKDGSRQYELPIRLY